MPPVVLDNQQTTSYNNSFQTSYNCHYGPNQSIIQIPFGQYLFQRVLSMGTKSIFGVPGDFNLPLLEYLYVPELVEQGLRWIGTANELNAAYACDGFSRYSKRIAVLITTYGVGELSAMNGIAGASSEYSRILHIVGVAKSTNSQTGSKTNHMNLHHLVPQIKDSNFVGPNHKIYYEMVKDKISCSTEYLEDINTACDKVDKVIEDIYKYSKPGYLFVPIDFVSKLVNVTNLIMKPELTLTQCMPESNPELIQPITDLVKQWIYESKTPAIIGDVLTDRFDANQLINELIHVTQFWNFNTFNGKSIINESNPWFMGQYNGKEGAPSVIQRFLLCDLILNIGIDVNEINSGHYSYNYKPNAKIVEMHPTYIKFIDTSRNDEQLFRDVNFVHILNEIIHSLDTTKLNTNYDPSVKAFDGDEVLSNFHLKNNGSGITQDHLARVIPKYFNPGDILVSETGSFQFALRDIKLPNQFKYITQGFYLSIGTALPSSFGVGIAMQDYPRLHITDNTIPEDYEPKLILFTGDGSAQMTVQEMTSMIRYKTPMEIFIWNNYGYTIERAILGPTRAHNDVMAWDWTKFLKAFGDFNDNYTESVKIDKISELNTKLKQLKNDTNRNKIKLMEIMLDKLDYPESLRFMVEAASIKQKQERHTQETSNAN